MRFEKGDKAFTFDLKTGYHHVDIHQSYWKYLGFSWDIEGVQTYFIFKVFKVIGLRLLVSLSKALWSRLAL